MAFAAGRLRMLCRMAKTKEEREKLYQAAGVWITTLESLARMTLEVTNDAKRLTHYNLRLVARALLRNMQQMRVV